MELTLMKENEDGSADFDLTLTCIEVQQIVRFGLIEMLTRAVEEGKKHGPSEVSLDNTASGEPSCAYGPCVKSGKSGQPCLCDQVTKVP